MHNHGHKHGHEHNHAMNLDGKDERLKLNEGKKWVPDEVLIKNMDTMHTGLVELRTKEKKNKATQNDYLALKNIIDTSTEEIITKCKMNEEMDNAYHVILEQILNSSEKLVREKDRGTASQDLVKTFMLYQHFFKQSFHH